MRLYFSPTKPFQNAIDPMSSAHASVQTARPIYQTQTATTESLQNCTVHFSRDELSASILSLPGIHATSTSHWNTPAQYSNASHIPCKCGLADALLFTHATAVLLSPKKRQHSPSSPILSPYPDSMHNCPSLFVIYVPALFLLPKPSCHPLRWPAVCSITY